jgi:hypothetical protein
MNELTEQEQNLIKDLLKHIGRDDDFNKEMASAVGMSVKRFDKLAESIFKKLGNGRVTFVEK